MEFYDPIDEIHIKPGGTFEAKSASPIEKRTAILLWLAFISSGIFREV
jgi:hypothetical protein